MPLLRGRAGVDPPLQAGGPAKAELSESLFRSEARCRWSIPVARTIPLVFDLTLIPTLAFDLTLILTLASDLTLRLAVLRYRRLPALPARCPGTGRLLRSARTSALCRD